MTKITAYQNSRPVPPAEPDFEFYPGMPRLSFPCQTDSGEDNPYWNLPASGPLVEARPSPRSAVGVVRARVPVHGGDSPRPFGFAWENDTEAAMWGNKEGVPRFDRPCWR